MSVIEEKDAIRDMMTRYCLAIDAGRYEEWVQCFTEDSICDSPFSANGKAGMHCGRLRQNIVNGRGIRNRGTVS